MNRLFAGIFLIATMGYTTKQQQSTDALAKNELPSLAYFAPNKAIQGPEFPMKPYEVSLQMARVESNQYELIVGMQLFNGAYFVSPNSKRDFKGKFSLRLRDSKAIEPLYKLEERPLSIEVYDPHPFVDGPVNWVRANTTYIQRLVRHTEANFEVLGEIQFTIEPRCTLEKIPIIILYKDGEMHVELFQC